MPCRSWKKWRWFAKLSTRKKTGTVVDKKQLMAEFSKMNSLSGSERQTTVGAKKK